MTLGGGVCCVHPCLHCWISPQPSCFVSPLSSLLCDCFAFDLFSWYLYVVHLEASRGWGGVPVCQLPLPPQEAPSHAWSPPGTQGNSDEPNVSSHLRISHFFCQSCTENSLYSLSLQRDWITLKQMLEWIQSEDILSPQSSRGLFYLAFLCMNDFLTIQESNRIRLSIHFLISGENDAG